MIKIQYPLRYKTPPEKECKNCEHYAYCKFILDTNFELYFNFRDCKQYRLSEMYEVRKIKDKELENKILDILESNQDKLEKNI